MKREITVDRQVFRGLLAVLLALAAFVGLALLGRAYTPDPPRVVGWADWWAIKVERQYHREIARLREDLGDLSAMLRSNPDPVQAELAASRLEQGHGHGLQEQQRAAVIAAAWAVRAGPIEPVSKVGHRAGCTMVDGQFQPVEGIGRQVDLAGSGALVQLAQCLAEGPAGVPLHAHRLARLGLDGPAGAGIELEHDVVDRPGGLELYAADCTRLQARVHAHEDVDAEL
jgi:hypothetical protein